MIATDDLCRFPMLAKLSSADRDALASVMRQRSFPRNTILFQRGDPGETMMLILSGRVRIFMRDDSDNEITFRTLGAGQVIGEFTLLDGKPRSASAVVDETLDALILCRADFLRLLQERPLVGVELMRNLAERIRYATNYLERLYDALDSLARNEYAEALREASVGADEDEIQTLIKAFVTLVRRVEAGERQK